jgi:hypothetical protein
MGQQCWAGRVDQNMTSSRTIMLFAPPPPLRTGPSAFVISILVHIVAVAVVFVLTLRHAPRINDSLIADRYTVRMMDLHAPEPQSYAPSGGGISYPGPKTMARASKPGSMAAPPAASRQFAQMIPSPLTLVQPDVPPNVLLPRDARIPSVLLWSSDRVAVKKIIPPPPQEATMAMVRPALIPPNREVQMADIAISSTTFVSKAPAFSPSTTSPLVVRGPDPLMVPATTSRPVAEPTPARVMSLSDLQVREGMIALPLANQTARAAGPGALGAGRSKSISQAAGNNPSNNQNGAGAEQGSADQRGVGDHAASGNQQGSGDKADSRNATGSGDKGGSADKGERAGSGSGATAQNGTNSDPNQGSGSGSDSGTGPATTQINLPKDGKFGVVVVGSSLAEEYPDSVGIWGGRLAYTVYLHMGLAKNWILQYSLPRNVDAATAGVIIRPEAPWPYRIVRPNLDAADFNAEAIMIHGFVNVTGHFEHLSILFPPQLPQARFVLETLQQWQFRPASQNGGAATVEVMLIIPEPAE